MRLFFAVWPPAAAAAALHAWAEKAARAAGGRVTRADSIHLTVAFLGEVSEDAVIRAIQAGRRANAPSHFIPIETARYWPRNRIVWAGPQETPRPLRALFEGLKGNLLETGFELEPRPFSSHVTLIRRARAPRELPPLPRVEWPVRELLLVRSALSAQGSRYEVVERFPLAA